MKTAPPGSGAHRPTAIRRTDAGPRVGQGEERGTQGAAPPPRLLGRPSRGWSERALADTGPRHLATGSEGKGERSVAPQSKGPL